MGQPGANPILVYPCHGGGPPGGPEVKASACNVGDVGSIPGSERSPGERNGNPLQYSCLDNPMDGGAWWATVNGVPKGRTRLSDLTFMSWWHLWTQELGKPSCCPGLQVMPILYSNFLCQRPTLGRTTLKKSRCQRIGQFHAWIGRASLNPQRGKHCNLNCGAQYSSTQVKEARSRPRERQNDGKNVSGETMQSY